MGKNARCLGSVLFVFYDYQGSVRFEFLLRLLTLMLRVQRVKIEGPGLQVM